MSFPTTAEQCATVQAALDRARLTGYGEAPADALTAVCQFFLDYADDYAAGE